MSDDDDIKDMASLLLKGATMLSVHCGNCKNPLFEKDGQTLCPKCGGVRILTEEEAAAMKAEDKEREKLRPRKTADDKMAAVLEKKRQTLLDEVEKEQDPEKLTKLLEAVEKINSML